LRSRFSRKRQASLNVFSGEVREVRQNFRFGHAAGKVLKHICYGYSRSANSRFAAALAGFDGDDLAIIHVAMITKRIQLAR
jgi:hypothetical protein